MDIIKTIHINEVKQYIKNIFKKSGAYIILFGNINSHNFNFDKIKKQLNYPLHKFAKLKIKKNINIKHPNPEEKSKCVKISYFIGKFNIINNLHLIFTNLISSSLFFDDLRTLKQLGYLVLMNISKIEKEYYIYQQVQSELSCDIIKKHIKEFNKSLIDNFKKQDFNILKETVISILKKKTVDTNELFNNYYIKIIDQTYLFNKNELLLQHIDNITIDSLIEFIKTYILTNTNKCIINIH